MAISNAMLHICVLIHHKAILHTTIFLWLYANNWILQIGKEGPYAKEEIALWYKLYTFQNV